MERKDFNFLTPIEFNIHSTEPPKMIRKKEKEQQDAFLLKQKRLEEEAYLRQLLNNSKNSFIQ